MDETICGEIELVENVLQAEDFVRLRIEAGFAEIPVEHARKALRNGLVNVSALYRGELVGDGQACRGRRHVLVSSGDHRPAPISAKRNRDDDRGAFGRLREGTFCHGEVYDDRRGLGERKGGILRENGV